MQLFIASDHRGYDLKNRTMIYLEKKGYKVTDAGDKKRNPEDDYPLFATKVVHKILHAKDRDVRGILFCGSGQGMIMAANRFKGIRAGLGWSVEAAKGIRNDEDSNLLVIPADVFIDNESTLHLIIDTWLNTPFANASRYRRRIKELDELS
jgi:ribose 5-phosphate isomerase B